MKFKRRKRIHSAVEAGSLSDILFFLMLFFLMISTLASPNAISVLLPRANNAKDLPPAHKIHLTIDKDKHYFVEGKEINPADLQKEISVIAKQQDNPTVVINIDKTVAVEELVKAVDEINVLKIPAVVASEKKSK